MGWREQTGLGKKADGRHEPIQMAAQCATGANPNPNPKTLTLTPTLTPILTRYATLGLGKASEYEEKAEAATEF